MNILETIIHCVFGSLLLSAIYHSTLYFLTKNKLLANYCAYLWSGCFMVFTGFFYREDVNKFNSPQFILADVFFHFSIFAYFVFIFSAFNITKITNRRLWFFYKIALILIFLQGLISTYARFTSPQENQLFFVSMTISSIYMLFFIIYSIFCFVKLAKTKFDALIIVGVVFNALFVIISLSINYYFGNKQISLLSTAITMIGIFIDVAVFSVAMGYKFKENLDEKLLAVNKAAEYQLSLYKAEIQHENEITIAKEIERKKLSQDLHDDLANSIANVKIRIETEILKSDDEALQNRLQKISDHVTDAYKRTRDKSHEWHNLMNEESESLFKNKIQQLLNDTLPDNMYQKEIAIDDESIQNVPANVKTEMLFIIQEAIINIQNHAKAAKVQILIYEDLPGLVLQITDDGKGFDTTINYASVGLKSLKSRVSNLKGEISIQSDKSGTTIQVVLPPQ